jgi:hypothetical protein
MVEKLSIDDNRALDDHLLNAMLILAKECRLMQANGSVKYRTLVDGGKTYKILGDKP